MTLRTVREARNQQADPFGEPQVWLDCGHRLNTWAKKGDRIDCPKCEEVERESSQGA